MLDSEAHLQIEAGTVVDVLTHARRDLERIQEETRKAASYLAVSRAVFRVPKFASRWVESDCQWAMDYTRKGTHMAFAVTLAATYDEKSNNGIVSIPNLIKKFGNHAFRDAISVDRRISPEKVNTEAQKALEKFKRIKALPIYVSLKHLRHNVIAHHNREIDHHGATQGALNRLMVATLALVDRMAISMNGEPTDTCRLIYIVRQTATDFWEYGIDGKPEVDE